MEEITKFITSIGFPAAIAVLMWWNNRQITQMLEKHYETMFTWVESISKLLLEGRTQDDKRN